MKRFALISSLVLLGACTAITYHPDQMTHAEKIQVGQQLYAGRCSACHPLIDPATLAGMPGVMAVDTYGGRAGLTAAERELVKYYLALGPAAQKPSE